jgi:hypothetical protein
MLAKTLAKNVHARTSDTYGRDISRPSSPHMLHGGFPGVWATTAAAKNTTPTDRIAAFDHDAVTIFLQMKLFVCFLSVDKLLVFDGSFSVGAFMTIANN